MISRKSQPGLPLGLDSRRRVSTFAFLPRFRPRRVLLFTIIISITILYVYRSRPSSLPTKESPDHSSPHRQQQRDTPKRGQDSIQKTEQQNRKPVANRRPKHYYRPDGHIDVNFDATHPVFELLSRAEKAWALKHEKASKTLGQAVAEYRRRYNRLPPAGFDKW